MLAASFGVSHTLAFFILIFMMGHTLAIGIPYVIHFYDNASGQNPSQPSPRSYLRAFLVEWWFGLAVSLSYPAGLVGRGLRSPHDRQGGPPIVMLHGYMMNRASFFALYWRLRRRGYRNIHAVNLRPLIKPLAEQVKALQEILQEISKLADGEPLVLIGHSQGGLLCRSAASTSPPIAKVITLGTPHHGTRLAYLGYGANARDLEPGSALLRAMPETPPSPVTSLYSDLDQIVVPAESARGAPEAHFFAETGHFALLYRKAVASVVADEIAAVSKGH